MEVKSPSAAEVSVRKRGRPRRLSEAERRLQLMDAALRVFVRMGFHASRIEDIVAEARTGKGTFYLYFKDKDELLLALLEKFFGEIRQTLRWVGERVAGSASIEELFEAEAERILDILMKHRELAELFLRMRATAGRTIQRKMQEFYGQILRASEKNLQLAAEYGLIPALDTRIAATCIVGAIEKTYEAWLRGQLKLPKARIARETLRFLLRGIGLDLARLGSVARV